MTKRTPDPAPSVRYAFTPLYEGGFVANVSDRDLTDEDVSEIDPALLRRAVVDGWYIEVSPKGVDS